MRQENGVGEEEEEEEAGKGVIRNRDKNREETREATEAEMKC